MAIRLLVIGDLHIKKTNLSIIDTLLIRILKVIRSTTCDAVVILGDTLHTHEKISMEALSKATHFLKTLTEVVNVFLLIGNHDRINNSDFLSSKHPFEALKMWKNIWIIDRPRHFKIAEKNFVFVPYVSCGRFHEALDLLKESVHMSDITCIFAHQEFRGAQMGAIKSTVGDKWDKENALVVSGHIHQYQVLQNNLIYVGTPYMSKYGEKDNKVILLMTFEESALKRDLIDLKMPKKRIIHLTPEQLSSFKYTGEDEIKIKVSGDLATLKSLSKSDTMNQLAEQGINIMFKPVQTSTKREQSVQRSYADIFRELVKENKDCLTLLNKLLNSEQ
jgi:DNA repair exonuclease SbcCD nuclease subunit